MTRKGSIYTLSDPRDGAIRYVGKTMRPLPERLAGHLSAPTNPAMRLWISTLTARGLSPVIRCVATATEEQLSAKEDRLIFRHARDGHRLFNSPYYHEYMDDLMPNMTPPSDTPAPADPIREFYRAQFGPIASARIAGRTSRRRAAWEIAKRVPVLLCFVLWQVPAIRYAARLALVCTYLWLIGFDRLFKSEVLPHLPVRAVGSFASEYLAAPFLTLGLHALVVLLVWSVLVYREVRAEVAQKTEELQKPVSPLDADLVIAAVAELDRAFSR